MAAETRIVVSIDDQISAGLTTINRQWQIFSGRLSQADEQLRKLSTDAATTAIKKLPTGSAGAIPDLFDTKAMAAKLKEMYAQANTQTKDFATKLNQAMQDLTLQGQSKSAIKTSLAGQIERLKELQREQAQIGKVAKEVEAIYLRIEGLHRRRIALAQQEEALAQKVKEAARVRARQAEETNLKNKQAELAKLQAAFARQGEILQRRQAEAAALANVSTQRLAGLERTLYSLDKSFMNVTFGGLTRFLARVGTLVATFYSLRSVMDSIFSKGLQLNKTIEDGSIGFAALIASNSTYIKSNGEAANAMERYNIALGATHALTRKIKVASLETAATFPQMIEVIQQGMGGALSAGKAMGENVEEITDNLILFAKRLTNVGTAMGMTIDMMGEEMRSVMEGQVSRYTRIAKALGITNEQIKKARSEVGGMAKLLDERFAAFDSLANIETFTRNIEKLEDAFDSLQIELTKHLFDAISITAKNITHYINDWVKLNKENTLAWFEQAKLIAQIAVSFGAAAIATKTILKTLTLLVPLTRTLVAINQVLTKQIAWQAALQTLTSSKSVPEAIVKLTAGLAAVAAAGYVATKTFDKLADALDSVAEGLDEAAMAAGRYSIVELEFKLLKMEDNTTTDRKRLKEIRREIEEEYLKINSYKEEINTLIEEENSSFFAPKKLLGIVAYDRVWFGSTKSQVKKQEQNIKAANLAIAKLNFEYEQKFSDIQKRPELREKIQDFINKVKSGESVLATFQALSGTTDDKQAQAREKSLSWWIGYYEKIGQYGEAWKLKMEQLDKEITEQQEAFGKKLSETEKKYYKDTLLDDYIRKILKASMEGENEFQRLEYKLKEIDEQKAQLQKALFDNLPDDKRKVAEAERTAALTSLEKQRRLERLTYEKAVYDFTSEINALQGTTLNVQLDQIDAQARARKERIDELGLAEKLSKAETGRLKNAIEINKEYEKNKALMDDLSRRGSLLDNKALEGFAKTAIDLLEIERTFGEEGYGIARSRYFENMAFSAKTAANGFEELQTALDEIERRRADLDNLSLSEFQRFSGKKATAEDLNLYRRAEDAKLMTQSQESSAQYAKNIKGIYDEIDAMQGTALDIQLMEIDAQTRELEIRLDELGLARMGAKAEEERLYLLIRENAEYKKQTAAINDLLRIGELSGDQNLAAQAQYAQTLREIEEIFGREDSPMKARSLALAEFEKELSEVGTYGSFRASLQKSFSEAFAEGIVEALQSGDVKGAVAGMFSNIGGSMMSSFSSSFSNAIQQGFASMNSGGSFTAGFGGAGVNWSAMGAGLALTLAADQLTAQWTETERRDYLEEIAENTEDTYKALDAYLVFSRVFNLNALRFSSIAYGGSITNAAKKGGTSDRDPARGAAYGAAAGTMIAPGIGTMIGAAIGAIAGLLSTGSKTKISGYNSALSTLEMNAPDMTRLYSDAIKDQILQWTSIYHDSEQLYNVLVGKKEKSKKTLLGTRKKTTYYYEQYTMAESQMIAFLKQFGADNYGSLTADGIKNFTERMTELYNAFDAIEKITALANGMMVEEFDAQRAARNAKEAYEAFDASYGGLMRGIGYDITAITEENLADIINSDTLAKLIGRYGVGINVEHLNKAIEALYQSMDEAAKAAKALQEALRDQYQSQAEFEEWLETIPEAVTEAAKGMRAFIEAMIDAAKSLRGEIAGLNSEDFEYMTREYLREAGEFNALFGSDGTLKNDVTIDAFNAAYSELSESVSGVKGVMKGYDEMFKNSFEGSLTDLADRLDLASNVLAVEIVGNDAGLAENQTLGELRDALKAYNDSVNKQFGVMTSFNWEDISFAELSNDSLKRLVAGITGVSTMEELENVLNAMATLKYSDDQKAVLGTFDQSLISQMAKLFSSEAYTGAVPSFLAELNAGLAALKAFDGGVYTAGISEPVRQIAQAAQETYEVQAFKGLPDTYQVVNSKGEAVSKALTRAMANKEAARLNEEAEAGRQLQSQYDAAYAAQLYSYYRQMDEYYASQIPFHRELALARAAWGGGHVALYEDLFSVPPAQVFLSLGEFLGLDEDERRKRQMSLAGEYNYYLEKAKEMKERYNTPFAKGGIVANPTLFNFDRQIGLAGEAGAEAIIPLNNGFVPVSFGGGMDDLIEAVWEVGGKIDDLAAVTKEILRRSASIERRLNRWEGEGAPIRNAEQPIDVRVTA
ncbi:MAG: hypothetical protein LBT81_02330 [Helicobacteraceae bacterium]|jgi:hypothetical protein|nr:hypothetical protein [Helicobacteraceae bacterium]